LATDKNDIPLSLKLNDESLFLIDEKDYNSVVKNLINALNDKKLAQKMGIRTFYSEAIAINPLRDKKYSIYSTAVGGLVLR